MIDVEQDQRQRTRVAAGALEFAIELFLEAAPVEDVGQPVADDQVVDRLVIGVLGVFLVQELEDDRADLEAVAAGEQLLLADRIVVQEGAVPAAEILEPDLAVVEDEAGMAAGDRRDVGEAERHLARAADFERALGRDAEAPPQHRLVRMGDDDEVGFAAGALGERLTRARSRWWRRR